MKKIKSLFLILTSLALSSCGKSSLKANSNAQQLLKVNEDMEYVDEEEDDIVYSENKAVDLRKPEFRGGDPEDDEEEMESFDVDKVILHYYNEDGNCNNEE